MGIIIPKNPVVIFIWKTKQEFAEENIVMNCPWKTRQLRRYFHRWMLGQQGVDRGRWTHMDPQDMEELWGIYKREHDAWR